METLLGGNIKLLHNSKEKHLNISYKTNKYNREVTKCIKTLN